MLHLPNLLSVLRIFLVPLWIWMVIHGEYQLAFYTFIVAGITDALDGFIAKQFGYETELGAYLDPLADKALLVSAFALLGLQGHLPAGLVIIVISRDVLIVAGFVLAWLLRRPVTVRPLTVSKVNTTGQIVLVALLLAQLAFSPGLEAVLYYLIYIVGFLTILSAIAYLLTWLQHMARLEVPLSNHDATDQQELFAADRHRSKSHDKQNTSASVAPW